jgi:hypothetical protein
MDEALRTIRQILLWANTELSFHPAAQDAEHNADIRQNPHRVLLANKRNPNI